MLPLECKRGLHTKTHRKSSSLRSRRERVSVEAQLMKTRLLGLLAGIGIYALGTQPAPAVSITLNASGSGADGTLAASAAFTTSAGLLSVAITNLLSPTQIVSVGQTVSDLSFILSNAPGNLGATTASVACTRFRRHRVRCFDGAGGGSWRDGSLAASSSLRLCV
jgi:hypothetical protein